MPKLAKALEDVLTNLNNEPVVVEFEKMRTLVKNDTFLIKTEAQLKMLQQKMTQNVLDKALHATLKAEYESVKKAYDEHPYVINYNALLNDVNELLHTIKTIIE